MAPTSLHLPNGQVVTVRAVFGGLRFEPQDLNLHRSPLPPGWTIILQTAEDEEKETEKETDPEQQENQAIAKQEGLKDPIQHRYRQPTLHSDTMYISSILNPNSTDFKPTLSPSRQTAMMLWASLCWYFHQHRPDTQTSKGMRPDTTEEGQPKGEWCIRIKREGIFRGRHLLSKFERMGLIWSNDSSVGVDPDARTGEGLEHMFVSQRSFWAIDPRIFLSTLSPVIASPFPYQSPFGSRPSSPAPEDSREGSRTPVSVNPLSPRFHNLEGQNHGLWTPTTPGPFSSASHLPTYYPPPSTIFTLTDNVRHPRRPKPPRQGETFYTRYIPSVKQYLSFRTCSLSLRPVKYTGPISNKDRHSDLFLIPTDLDLLHSWMNKPRVRAAWGEQGPREHQEEFLRKNLSSKHSFPVFGCWDGKPFGYFEIYWVKEDLLGVHHEADDWDRGLHVLVGEEEFRGPDRVKAWLSSLVHWCFLADARTEAIYLEPRVDNEKFINYLSQGGFQKLCEITLPHKQSALMKMPREAFIAPQI